VSAARAARWAMGTLLRVEAEAGDARSAEDAREAFLDEVARLEALLSVYREDSDVSRVNRRAGEAPERVAPESFDAIAAALEFARLSDGAFDPTVLPLSSLWKSAGPAPTPSVLERRRRLVGHARVVLDAQRSSVFLPERGMGLDLGGFAKGFALDRALARARRAPGVRRVFADFGGQLLFWAREESPAPETVVLEDPRAPGRAARTIAVRGNASVSTSSQSERPNHLVEPRTGRPAAAAAVSVVASTAAEAEAWSTALFVAGRAAAALGLRPGVSAYFA